jgi:RluA family pseudouridine synthase
MESYLEINPRLSDATVKTPCPDNSAMPDIANSAPVLTHSAFYKFVRVTDADAVAELLRELSRDVLGSILVAPEGINGMVTASPDALASFELALATDARLHGLFSGMAFKHSACTTAPFQRMKVHSKPEVLPLGVDGMDGIQAVGHQGIQLNPQQWRELMQQDDVVLIDNRNHFEFRLGRFKGAVDPQVHNFRDFPAWLESQLPTWKAQNKRVAMYCTGGIRCEKTSAWMSQLGMPVLELEGGILNYFAQMPEAQKEWDGECFVFDNRVALNTRLEETGTRAEDVYGDAPDEQWRLERAKRLELSASSSLTEDAPVLASSTLTEDAPVLTPSSLTEEAPVLTPSSLTEEGGGGGENVEGSQVGFEVFTSTPALPRQGGGRKADAPLPTKNGVGPSCIVLPQGAWPTIAAFLIERFPGVAKEAWQHRIIQSEVLDEHGTPITPTQRHQPGLKLYYYRHIEAEARIPFEAKVLYQDELLVVADKPHFLPVTPGGKYLQETLLVRLKQSLGIDDLTPIHRIDRETAGVVMFCADPTARAAYAAMFAQRHVVKRYEAIVAWSGHRDLPLTHLSRMEEDAHFMRMREVPGAPNSETRIELMSVDGQQAHLKLSPVTGRKHQLRVHCAALGMPIVNDALYPVMKPQAADDFDQPLRLIARSIAFTDPLTSKAREFESSRTFNQPAIAASSASI